MDFKINNVEQFNSINEAHFHQTINENGIDKTRPHIVICPQCRGESYRFNEYCSNGKCTFGIRAYFDYQEWVKQKRLHKTFLQKKSQRLAMFNLIAIVSCFLGLYLGSLHPSGYLLFLVSGYLTFVFNREQQNLEKEINKIRAEELK